MKALRDVSPQALHHFTQADQVNQLVRGQRSGPRSEASWRGCWCCAPCHAPTLAIGISTSVSTGPTSSVMIAGARTNKLPLWQPAPALASLGLAPKRYGPNPANSF